MTDRRPGENALEYIARTCEGMAVDVRELRGELSAHALQDAEREGVYLGKVIALEGATKDAARRLTELEEVAEVTGVHNTDELKGKYYDARRELERLKNTHSRVILSAISAAVAGLAGLISHKLLGWP